MTAHNTASVTVQVGAQTLWYFRQILITATQAYEAMYPRPYVYRPWLPLRDRLAMRAES